MRVARRDVRDVAAGPVTELAGAHRADVGQGREGSMEGESRDPSLDDRLPLAVCDPEVVTDEADARQRERRRRDLEGVRGADVGGGRRGSATACGQVDEHDEWREDAADGEHARLPVLHRLMTVTEYQPSDCDQSAVFDQ